MKLTLAIIIATAYSLSFRLLFGAIGGPFEIMSLSFLVVVPALSGFLTVILLPATRVKTVYTAFGLPWLTTLALLVVTMFFKIEGAICWIMVYPFVSVVAGVGGVIAFHVKKNWKNRHGGPNGFNISFMILLPIGMGFIEGGATSATTEYQVSKEVIINAASKKVWNNLTHINGIAGNEHQWSALQIFSLPRHIKTTIDTLMVGGNRKAYFEKGLFFDETITQYTPQKLLVLAIKANPDKIPPTVMDEHVVIGGKHINVLQDTYTLEKLANGQCRLTLSSRFTVCTPFNWYATFWANLLMNDMLQSELNLVKARASAAK